MEKRVSSLPMIGVIAIASVAVLVTSIASVRQRRATEEMVENTAAADREKRDAETSAVNKQRGEDAARAEHQIALTQEQIYQRSAAAQDAKRLEDEDRRWLAGHPLSPATPRSAEH
jgi:hypothetical protein